MGWTFREQARSHMLTVFQRIYSVKCGRGSLAKRPAQALGIYQNNTFATSAKRLAKCTVMPSFKYSGNSSKLPRFGSGKISS